MAAPSSTDLPSQWADLSNLAQTLGALSSHKCLQDLQDILKYATSLRAAIQAREETIKQQEQTMSSKADEVIRLKEAYTRSVEDVLDTHQNFVKKCDKEKETIQEAMAVRSQSLKDAESRIQSLQNDLQALRKEADAHISEKQRLKADLGSARSENETLKKELTKHEARAGVREQKLNAEIAAHKETTTQAEADKKQCADLKMQLEQWQSDLDRFDKWAPALAPDNEGEVVELLGKLWKKCFRAALACSTVDIAEDVLQVRLSATSHRPELTADNKQDQSRWQTLKSSDLVTHATPLPPTNSSAAKRMRLFVVLALLAQSLMHNIFGVSYLFRDIQDINAITLAMADTDRDREAYFRRMLHSSPEPADGPTIPNRSDKVITDVVFRMQPLLTIDQTDKLKISLAEVARSAMELWTSVQKKTSHFAVETRVSSDALTDWKVLKWDEGKRILVEDTCRDAGNAISVLFPRVFMIAQSGDRVLFPGMLLLQSETLAAYDELSKLSPMSPSIKRASTHRSTVGGRSAGSDVRGNSNFLDARGTK